MLQGFPLRKILCVLLVKFLNVRQNLILQHCPNLNNITIQTIRDENYLRQLSRIEHLNTLTLASSLLNSLSLSCLDALCTKKLRKLRILQRYDEMKTTRNVLRQSQLTLIISAPLITLQISGIALKPNIFTKLCDALKETLSELFISGALCNSPDFDQYISAIGKCDQITFISLDPQKLVIKPDRDSFINRIPGLFRFYKPNTGYISSEKVM
ncbi:unnamed protein product [Onchocerca flexuosa]|uniref:F-box domain-containing protein n=1 Tax=Onchocerca flexuosa TaxID=387005 RepID=A0A183I6X6_9BILA|nr:unnamed protein product [Onchocerca flexuosa]